MKTISLITNSIEINLRQVNEDDIYFLYDLRLEWINYPKEYRISLKETPTFKKHVKFVKEFLIGLQYKAWYIIEHKKKSIGAIALKQSDEFGYQIRQSHQGQGLIHEAFRLFFEKHPKKTVWARTRPGNERSEGLLKKYGFKLTHYEYH